MFSKKHNTLKFGEGDELHLIHPNPPSVKT